MIDIRKIGTFGVLLLSFPLLAAQEGTIVKLTVKHDGQEKSSPGYITLSFDDRSVQISIHEGKFEVPPEVASAQKVTFATDVEGEHIRVRGISGRKFVRGNWTLLLAQRDYGEEYHWVLPKGADVSSSCILEFEPDNGEGTSVFVPQCRSRSE